MIDSASTTSLNRSTTSPSLSTAASKTATASPNGSATQSASAGNSAGPAAVLDLSDHAKAMIAQNRINQDVADRLEQQVAALKNGNTDQGSSGQKSKSTSSTDDRASIYKSLAGSTANAAGSTKWEAGAPYGDPTKSDADFLDEVGINTAIAFEDAGRTEAGQSLREALRNGTVKIQKASDIEGLNFKSWQVFTPNPNNGAGFDSAGGTSQNPTGDIKMAIDAGRAVALWTADRGDVYLSW